MLVPKNTAIIPVEEILKMDTDKLRFLVELLEKCEHSLVTKPSPVIIDIGTKRVSYIVGTGSVIVLDRDSCFPRNIESIYTVKNEWIETCSVDNVKHFEVISGDPGDRLVTGVRLISLTQKMIYPRVFNGHLVNEVKPLRSGYEESEWIMSDENLLFPVIIFAHKVIVTTGSPILEKIKLLLELESRCSHYRFLVS